MSQRTDQVGMLMQREISQILARDVEPPEGTLITVMDVSVTPDLKHAKVFVSILPQNRTGSGMDTLRRNTRHIQQLLNKKLAMKFIPAIHWELDLTNRKYAAIDEALKG